MISLIKTMLTNLAILHKINDIVSGVNEHMGNNNNPHKVTAAQLGLSSAYVFKGSVESYAALPTEGIGEGWVYNVQAADEAHNIKAGDNVAWTGSAWDVLSGIFDTSKIDANIVNLQNKYNELNTQVEEMSTTVNNHTSKITAVENKTANITVENGKTVIDGMKVEEMSKITFGTDDLIAGTSPLENGVVYLVYE